MLECVSYLRISAPSFFPVGAEGAAAAGCGVSPGRILARLAQSRPRVRSTKDGSHGTSEKMSSQITKKNTRQGELGTELRVTRPIKNPKTTRMQPGHSSRVPSRSSPVKILGKKGTSREGALLAFFFFSGIGFLRLCVLWPCSKNPP